ncbi:MAG: hypothetical protein COT85_08060 [Chlamydiae bacterium CG10_big_fil_rev_8_21_14_0_10_42_34]|nr:MAG: hypothetical protein COT85_08060 [Chlamydiae bacterium CG10_big_fil_rev_8_21_14_0_10_42_34]
MKGDQEHFVCFFDLQIRDFMISSRFLLLLGILVLGNSYGSENETCSDTTQTSNDSSQAKEDEGPSVVETIAQIANDAGAGFGGDR